MSHLYYHIAEILHAARRQAVLAVNVAMVQAYWEIGRTIVEEEQQRLHRAEYGASMIAYLAQKLRADFGKGHNKTNLKYFRQFYLAFQNRHAVRDDLSWTHYRSLLRVPPQARDFYMQEAIVKYSVLNESAQLFASKYMLYLPSEAELRAELERERAIY